MIAVIADDFTGAAEIGGIGLRYGLKVVIETEDIQDYKADLLIIATDTRSLSAKEASALIFKVTKKILMLNPDYIFKKVDSVLRGNIADELFSQIEASGKSRAIIVAANPIFKRMIRKGIYYIDNIPLSETNFALDPEYPVSSSNVLEIVGKGKKLVYSDLKPTDDLPENGLIIGDVTSFDDLEKWTERLDNNTVIAGASGFFDMLLAGKKTFQSGVETHNIIPFGTNVLYVFGSAFPKDLDALKKMDGGDFYISNMPEEIYYNNNYDPSYLEKWADDIVKGILRRQKVVASIDYAPVNDPDIALRIKESIGKLIKRVTERININELLIEGGSTTSVVLKYMNINKLIPIQELETGVIRMKIDEYPKLCLTTKPGSYFWPDSVWLTKDVLPIKGVTE
jgi:D-threonate/D-erythronate kinase